MTSPVTFLKEVRVELTKVVWPTRSEIVRLTVFVFAISFAVGLMLGAIDFAFVKIMEVLL